MEIIGEIELVTTHFSRGEKESKVFILPQTQFPHHFHRSELLVNEAWGLGSELWQVEYVVTLPDIGKELVEKI